MLPSLLAVLPALLVLLGLGAWQLQRLGWKEALIAERESRLAAPPASLAVLERLDAAQLAHRRVRLQGRFLNERELFFGLRTHAGVPGLELLSPLRLDDGRTVMVNRGWIPADRRAKAARPETRPEGPVEVVGIVRPATAEPGWFTPANEPAANQWYSYDLAAMAREVGSELLPFVVEATAAPGERALPIGRGAAIEIRNDHLQYAITWFALAAALATIFVLFHRRRAGPPAG